MSSSPPPFVFNPFIPPHQVDPYPAYAQAREQYPVFYNPVFSLCMVARYSDVMTVLREPQRFSSRPTLRMPPDLVPAAAALLKESTAEEDSLVNEDPPQHTHRRAIISKAFVPQRIATLEPRVRRLAGQLFARFARDGQVEHMGSFAHHLPMQVICAVIGIPESDFHAVRAWSGQWTYLLSRRATAEEQVVCAQGVVAFQRYMEALVEARRQAPEDDLATDLLNARMDGVQLTTTELGTFLRGLVAAGYETTLALVGSVLKCLLLHREQWERVVADPKLIPAAVEETLRYVAPLRGMLRMTTTEVELGGAVLPAGTMLMPLFASANRDAEVFADPDRFDPQRPDKDKHLGFGRGIHTCLGSLLARLEAQITVELYTQLPNLRLQEGQSLLYEPFFLTQRPQRLLLTWDV